MRALFPKKTWNPNLITFPLILIGLGLLLWSFPSTHAYIKSIDHQAFYILNGSLVDRPTWQWFWGYLNHPNESWMNVLAMMSLNVVMVFFASKFDRKKVIWTLLFYWFCFQFVLLGQYLIFDALLDIHRASPSLVLTPLVLLSETLSIPGIKDASSISFPAGHTLVAIYWLLFSWPLTNSKTLRMIILTVALVFTFSRMISGAHWLSDCVFTVLLAFVWYGLISRIKPSL